MKLTLRKILTVLPVALLAILFTGVMISCSNDSGSDNGLALLLGGNKQTSPNKEKPVKKSQLKKLQIQIKKSQLKKLQNLFLIQEQKLLILFLEQTSWQVQKLQLLAGSGINCLNIMILIPLTKNVFMQNTALKRMVKSGQ
ncbi:MAG: hypothetical protein IIW99_04865 [Treponema sp.]|nr:hypothetical protein [Treponema sp.]